MHICEGVNACMNTCVFTHEGMGGRKIGQHLTPSRTGAKKIVGGAVRTHAANARPSQSPSFLPRPLPNLLPLRNAPACKKTAQRGRCIFKGRLSKGGGEKMAKGGQRGNYFSKAMGVKF